MPSTRCFLRHALVSYLAVAYVISVRNLSLRRRQLVNAYEVEAGIGVIAGNMHCVIHA